MKHTCFTLQLLKTDAFTIALFIPAPDKRAICLNWDEESSKQASKQKARGLLYAPLTKHQRPFCGPRPQTHRPGHTGPASVAPQAHVQESGTLPMACRTKALCALQQYWSKNASSSTTAERTGWLIRSLGSEIIGYKLGKESRAKRLKKSKVSEQDDDKENDRADPRYDECSCMFGKREIPRKSILKRPPNSRSLTSSGTWVPKRSFTQVVLVRSVMPSPQQYHTIPTSLSPAAHIIPPVSAKHLASSLTKENLLGTRVSSSPCCRYTNFCASVLPPLFTSYSRGLPLPSDANTLSLGWGPARTASALWGRGQGGGGKCTLTSQCLHSLPLHLALYCLLLQWS